MANTTTTLTEAEQIGAKFPVRSRGAVIGYYVRPSLATTSDPGAGPLPTIEEAEAARRPGWDKVIAGYVFTSRGTIVTEQVQA